MSSKHSSVNKPVVRVYRPTKSVKASSVSINAPRLTINGKRAVVVTNTAKTGGK